MTDLIEANCLAFDLMAFHQASDAELQLFLNRQTSVHRAQMLLGGSLQLP